MLKIITLIYSIFFNMSLEGAIPRLPNNTRKKPMRRGNYSFIRENRVNSVGRAKVRTIQDSLAKEEAREWANLIEDNSPSRNKPTSVRYQAAFQDGDPNDTFDGELARYHELKDAGETRLAKQEYKRVMGLREIGVRF